MSTTLGHLEPELAPVAMVPVPDHHKRLAPKVGPSAESNHQWFAKESNAMVTMSLVTHQKYAASSTGQQQQTQDPPASPQFEFINTTTDAQYSEPGSRGVARSHVMRNFHRKKGKSRLQQGNLQGPSTSQSLLTPAQVQGQSTTNRGSSRLIDVDETGLHRLDEDSKRDLIHSEKGDGAGNNSALWLRVPQRQECYEGSRELPMSNLWALPVDTHATELISHYIQIFAKSFVPMKQTWESEWFKNALSDPACFYSTLFLSAAHKALLTGTEDPLPVECFQHKGEVIRIINERLSDPTRRVADGTIAAIACLAAFETLGGTTTDASVHVDGLEKLVLMRGGLKRLGMDGFLEQFLYWVDLSNATATKEKPHFLPFDMPPVYFKYFNSEALWKYCDSQWNDEYLDDLPEKSYQGLDIVENRLFLRLQQLTILAASNPTMTSGPNQEAYTDAVLLLERQIGVAVQEQVAFRKRFGGVTFSPPTCLFYIPALIFCYMILRRTPIRSSIYEPLVMRMKHHIDHLKPTQLFDRFPPEFWFWALLLVGTASMGRPQQEYFQRIMAQLCSLLDIHSWGNAKDILKEFAWGDAIYERPCKAFWNTLDGMDGNKVEEGDMMDYIQLHIYSS